MAAFAVPVTISITYTPYFLPPVTFFTSLDLLLGVRQLTWYQNDETSGHYARTVKEYLDEVFSNR